MALTARPFDGVAYTAAQWQSLERNTNGDGVIPTGGRFVVSSPGAGQISVTSGAAWVDGVFCEDPSSVTKSFTVPAATTGAHVVLRVVHSTKTASIEVVLNGSGNTAIPALTQTSGGTYEIRLASFLTDNAGNVSNLVDTRPFLRPNNLLLRRQGGSVNAWNTAGTTNYTPRSNAFQAGSTFVDESGAVAQLTGYTKTVAVTFPTPFAAAPLVLVGSVAPGSQSSEIWNVGPGNVTATGFTMFVIMSSLDANSAHIPWLAIGPT